MNRENLCAEERLPLGLRALYRSYGYEIYRMNHFEPYDLYRENRNFLNQGRLLTFTDGNGRLMALRPDVTISIVKETKAEQASRKLFYSEHLFRRQKGAEQLTEIKQMGLEFIGAGPGYGEAEVAALALQSLEAAAILAGPPGEAREYFLSISQMDYVGALLTEFPDQEGLRQRLAEAIRRKSASDIRLALGELPVEERLLQAIYQLISLPPEPQESLAMLAKISVNPAMDQAVQALAQLLAALAAWEMPLKLRIDLSLLNDFDYYNGLIFQGYIQGLPRPVLSGGRYDNMLRRFNKPQPAIGFALYLSELRPLFRQCPDEELDVLLLYGEASPAETARAVRRLTAQGLSVRAEAAPLPGLKARRIMDLGEDC